MCGIFGYSIPLDVLSPEERAVLAAMLGAQNDNRGGDSWGAYIVNGEVQIRRGLGDVATGLGWPAALKDAHLLMGHTRKATTGAISLENSHPFEAGNVVGAHNGYISNHDEMNKKYNRNFAVDSMHIFAHIQKGWRLTELTGWGAIEYTNKKKWPERVNLCKLSSGGDLAIAAIDATVKNNTVHDPHGIVWSSSEKHLKYALDTAGLEGRYTLYKIDEGTIYSVEKGNLATQARKLYLGSGYTSRSVGFCGTGYGGNYSGAGTGRGSRSTVWEKWDGLPSDSGVILAAGFNVHYDEDVKFYVDTAALRGLFTEEPAVPSELASREPLVVPPPNQDDAAVAADIVSEDLATVNQAILDGMERAAKLDAEKVNDATTVPD